MTDATDSAEGTGSPESRVRVEVVDFKLSPFGRHTFYGVDIKE